MVTEPARINQLAHSQCITFFRIYDGHAATYYRCWTDEEIETLKALVADGASPVKAAAALNRKMESVRTKSRIVGTPFLPLKRSSKVLPLKEARKGWVDTSIEPHDVPPWRR